MVEVCKNGPSFHTPLQATSSSGWALSGISAPREYHSRSEKKLRISENFDSIRGFDFLEIVGEEGARADLVDFAKLAEGDRC